MKTDILGVFAHPDDETGVAATLAHYSLGEGAVVPNVYCTRGEGGGNMAGTQWGAALGILREAELRDCLARLGVRYCFFLDQLDFFYTESVAATFRKWGKEETLRRLVRHVRALRPDVIVTMNPGPTPGQHGHHQAAAVLATEAFDAAANPARFPEQLSKEGLSVWQVRKLYYGGTNGPTVATIITTESLPDGKTPAEVAAEALSNHRSQAFGNFANSPWLRRPQSFTLVKSVVAFTGPETDLLRGLPVQDANAKPLHPPQPAESDVPVELQFVPRPAIVNYRSWAREQNIEHVAGQFAADVPIMAGKENELKFEIRGKGPHGSRVSFTFAVPEGWQMRRNWTITDVNGPSFSWPVSVKPPHWESGDVDLTATLTRPAEGMTATVRLHLVPHLKVPRLKRAPALDGTASGWEHIPVSHISSTNLAQGRTMGETDSSADFQLAHDGKMLFIDVDVKDDFVVSNIAPNDIRGHWRTDAVEICIDPAAGAEDTLNCYKIGIFPFDTSGHVRAARDADANQGPIEETAPKTGIASSRTNDGYRIQAGIPFSEIGISGKKTRRLGFNIIVYDGDKHDAAIGENINKSRIAWSPRAGVQGRPEDWGRIDLE